MIKKREVTDITGVGLAELPGTAVARQGWDVRVHQKSAEVSEIGSGLHRYAKDFNALPALGAYDRFAASVVPTTVPRLLCDYNNTLIKIGVLKINYPNASCARAPRRLKF